MERNAKTARACIPAGHSQTWRWRLVQIEHLSCRRLSRASLHQHGSAAKNRGDQPKWTLDIRRQGGRARRSHKTKVAVGCLRNVISNCSRAGWAIDELARVLFDCVYLTISLCVRIVAFLTRRELSFPGGLLSGHPRSFLGP